MDDRTRTSLARRGVELEEIHRPNYPFGNGLLQRTRGHLRAPRGAKLGSSCNPLVHSYCAAFLVSCVQMGRKQWLSSTGGRRNPTRVCRMQKSPTSLGNVFVVTRIIDATT